MHMDIEKTAALHLTLRRGVGGETKWISRHERLETKIREKTKLDSRCYFHIISFDEICFMKQ